MEKRRPGRPPAAATAEELGNQSFVGVRLNSADQAVIGELARVTGAANGPDIVRRALRVLLRLERGELVPAPAPPSAA